MKLVRPKRSILGIHFIGLGAVLTTVHFNAAGTTWAIGALFGLAFVLAGLMFAPKPNFKSFFTREKLPVIVPIGIILTSAFLGIFVHGQTSTGSFYLAYLVLTVLVFLYGTIVSRWTLIWVVPVALLNTPAIVLGGILEPLIGGHGLTGNSGLAGTLCGLALVVGFIFLKNKLRWFLLIPLLGVIFAGDHWTWIGLAVVAVVMLIKRELPIRWTLTVVGLVAVILVFGLRIGYTEPLYGLGENSNLVDSKVIYSTLSYRLTVIDSALSNTSVLGHGVQLDTTDAGLNRYSGLVHNVPMMIWDDLGPLAALAWLFLMVRAIIKSEEYRYALIFVLVTSMFSYWFWWPLGLGMFSMLLLGLAEGPVIETLASRNLLRMVERMKSEA
jgi:hypothetical protein